MVFWYLRAWESCSCLIPEAGYLRCWNSPIVSVSHWRSWGHNNCLFFAAGDLENLEVSWRVIGPFDSCTEIRTNFFSTGIRSSNKINSLVATWKTLNELELSMFLQFMLPTLKIMQKLNIKCKELSKMTLMILNSKRTVLNREKKPKKKNGNWACAEVCYRTGL